MSIFDLHAQVIEDYSRYVRSFLLISDDRIRDFVEHQLLRENVFWPDALLQLSPEFETASDVDGLAAAGVIHPETASIFRTREGSPLRLFRHQEDALKLAGRKQSYVVTSGTGSGKSLTYFIPIFDAVLRKNREKSQVRAIVIYPMNALVNSQFEALTAFGESFEKRTGAKLPVRFAKYTGQEKEAQKQAIRQDPPHILLTNFMMLEMMLVRPQEAPFVNADQSDLEFLVIDELHMYRGRQGADVAMLVRRLKERCGRPDLLHVGTSATMVAGAATSPQARREAVASFASRLFGSNVLATSIVEESLVKLSQRAEETTQSSLRGALHAAPPEMAEAFVRDPLMKWIEAGVGIEEEEQGRYRRKRPRSLKDLAIDLASETDATEEECRGGLQRTLLAGSRLKKPSGGPALGFKLHQFFSQGRSVYATLESRSDRYLTLEGQYYAPQATEKSSLRILVPLVFCRMCGQEYYRLRKDPSGGSVSPWENDFDDSTQGAVTGYLFVPASETFSWSDADLPSEWLGKNGRPTSTYRDRIPKPLHVRSDGSLESNAGAGAISGYFQPSGFSICQTCGEFYTKRERDFRKLTGLSNEGRSSATTVLSLSTLNHAPKAGITDSAKKILSFTDNRQDASLQAGHFNDFVLVTLLRSAIYKALEHGELRHFEISRKVVETLEVKISEVAENRQLAPDSPNAETVWSVFRDLIEYRIYEDLRRGWRVIHPNLEQCGLLEIEYQGLKEACEREDLWRSLPPLDGYTADRRYQVIKPVLDFARRKLIIRTDSLEETKLQQLRIRVNQHINERWKFDDDENFRLSERLVLPNQAAGRSQVGTGTRSLIGRYLLREMPDISPHFEDFVKGLLGALEAWGVLIRKTDHNKEYLQIDAGVLTWKRGNCTPPPPDPLYSRRVAAANMEKAIRDSNRFFSELYGDRGRTYHQFEGREHTAQIGAEEREDRERRFREGDLKALFCSPTMELGIDIRDLQLVHMRNVPPTPANYAQRGGRAGRTGEPALILTYCSARSAHDQYFFQRRDEIVAGSVKAPRIDLSNEDLVRAHVQAIWFAAVNLSIQRSISELLDLNQPGSPLNENVRNQAYLSATRLLECKESADRVLTSCGVASAEWFTPKWLDLVLESAAENFDRAFDRWRQLYDAATAQLLSAQQVQATALDSTEQELARQRVAEAIRQRNLLTCIDTSREESDFYPYRYLASEGFLPGYNFPRLPLRAFVPTAGKGEFISRPRFLALTEFGPNNLVYHEGSKFEVVRFLKPSGGLAARKRKAKLCESCGYFNPEGHDRCDNCKSLLDGAGSRFVSLLEAPNVKTVRRSRITCDEEERIKKGYETTTHFRFATAAGKNRTKEAVVGPDPEQERLRLVFAPSASVYRINHGWRRSQGQGFLIDLDRGEILTPGGPPPLLPPQNPPESLALFVNDTQNILLIYPPASAQQDERFLASLEFALQRGMEIVFQVEESELASSRIGSAGNRALLFWESSEGGAGVLRRLVEEQELIRFIAQAALDRLHFSPDTGDDRKTDCSKACYECLLSYSNQLDHKNLDRHAVKDFLLELLNSTTMPLAQGQDYEAHYQTLKALTDSRSDLERYFLEHLYNTRRILPEEAQKALQDPFTITDFYSATGRVCIYCDGSVHDAPEQKTKDLQIRSRLKDLGYRVIVIRYDQDLETRIAEYPDVFGTPTK
jgi:superfamily II DNA/RNA helicase/very-short-patch-repair endonuclease